MSSDRKKNSICFVAQAVYSLFRETPAHRIIGGAELQQKFIGLELKSKGYDVSYLSHDYGQGEVEIVDDITFHRTFAPRDGVFGVRFFYPRLFRIWRALKKADADIYYSRCAGMLPGIVALFCKVHGKKCVYGAANEYDFLPNQLKLLGLRDNALYRYGLRNSNGIVVQSNVQRDLLRKHFGLPAIVIRNFWPTISPTSVSSPKKHILWVANFRRQKRPQQFVELARRFPMERFVMIGGPGSDENLYKEMRATASKIENLAFLGFQSFQDTERRFDESKVYVSTSEHEGFPNTFLQAWQRGLPVISYVDPDNVIEANKLGMRVGSFQELVDALRLTLSGPGFDSNAIKQYFLSNHSSQLVDQYCSLIETLCRSGGKT